MKRHPKHKDIWVTKDGRVFRELLPSKDGAGYAQIRNGTLRQRRHVLVLETYHGLRPKGAVSRHLDGNPANDHPKNLAWGSQVENMQDKIRHGTGRGFAKVSVAQTKEIIRRRKAGESGKALAEEFGLSQARVCDLFKGRVKDWG